MPPDRGAVKRTSNTKDTKKDSKGISSRKDGKSVGEDLRSTRNVQEKHKVDRSPSTSRKDTSKPVAVGGVSSKKRVDVEKMKDVKDINRDLNKIKESLAKNRGRTDVKNSPYQTPTRAVAGSVYDRLSTKTQPASPASSQSSTQKPGTRQNQPASKSLPQAASTRSSSITQKSKAKVEKDVKKPNHVTTSKPSKSSSKIAKQLPEEKQPQKLAHERTRTRTLSPNEIKIARKLLQEPHVKEASTNRTSKEKEEVTKKSIDNREYDHGDMPASSSKESPSEGEKEYDYEDDFEDYESDFEEDLPESSDVNGSSSDVASISEHSSPEEPGECEVVEMASRPVVEEEKKLDSGNYDLTESKRKGKELQQIKEALEKENAIVAPQRTRGTLSHQHTLTKDEGFEEEKDEDVRPVSKTRQVGFINFAKARKRMEEQNISAKARKRGDDLLSMIKLDVVSFSLLELAPVSYDVYMKSYGRSNTVQAHVQTNEENLSEEVQCDEIVMKNKWTQNPVKFHPINKDDSETLINVFQQDRLGCGGDVNEEDPEAWKKQIKYDAARLNNFLLQRGQFILQFLEQKSNGTKNTLSEKKTSFSTGYISLDINGISFLSGRPVSSACFSSDTPMLVATVHNRVFTADSGSDDVGMQRFVICVWNTVRPASPQKILVCSEEVSTTAFDAAAANFIFCGLCDGTMCLWDLRETNAAHRVLNSVKDGWVLCSPTYSTAEILKSKGHLTRVTCVRALPNATSKRYELSPQQVCSLDATGKVIIWTVVQSVNVGVKSGLAQEDLGLAHWGRVRLVQSIAINAAESLVVENHLAYSLECRDLQIDHQDPNHFYVCTNLGHIIHCLVNGGKPNPRTYLSVKDQFSPATCLETCGFNQPFFMVGYEGGSVRLFGRGSSRALATYTGTGHTEGLGHSVHSLQWSSACPNIFFVLDATSRIHVWDLSMSDIHPVDSVQFENTILSMNLSQSTAQKKHYMMITTDNGHVQLHEMKPEFSQHAQTAFDEQLRIFLLYTSAL